MTFIRHAWYCSGWSHEISREPLSRTILGEPIVFFRKEDGSVAAIGDTCPHRLAPLHLGTLRGDAIECPYHGLQFAASGACILNPHGEAIPKALKVPSYTVVERDRTIWIWMGDPAAADPALIPDCSHHDDPKFRTTYERVPVAGHYELVTDNLLDMTHVRFLHKTFQAPSARSYDFELIQEGRTITSVYNARDAEKSEMLEMMWPDGPERVDLLTDMRWDAPANLLMRNCNTGAGRPEEEGILALTSHLITPETETSCHYFWAYSRNWRLDDDVFEKTLHDALNFAIRTDDSPMIEFIQQTMGDTGDLMSFRPVILPTDAAAIRARLIVSQLTKAESEALGAEDDGGARRRPDLGVVKSEPSAAASHV